MVTRRAVLQAGFAAGSLIITPQALYAATSKIALPDERELSVISTHTNERATATYWREGKLHRDGMREINHVLRDHRSGDIIGMDPKLMDFLYELKCAAGCNEPFHIISGYRSPATNAMLRGKSNGGVAKKSWHMQGRAIDIRVPGVKTSELRNLAVELKRGGVGYYASSDFVHIDTGPVRRW